MRLLSKFSDTAFVADFGRFDAVTGVIKKAGTKARKLVKKGTSTIKEGVDNATEAVQAQIRPEDVQALTSLAEDARTYRQGGWGKAAAVANVGMLAATPLALAPVFMESADTKAAKQMRLEDKKREAMGLAPLAVTPQMRKEDEMTAAAASYSRDDTRVINMAPKYLLPGELPTNSLR